MGSLLVKVRGKMSIATYRRALNALEGEHASAFKGRSLDFDDLREYVPGDDVKDIDWKATARSAQVLIKRYIAIRKYNIMLVVDTSRSMAATAPSGESKRDIAVMAAGVIAAVAQKHADLTAMTAGNSERVFSLPFKDSRAHAERILQYINGNIAVDAPASDLTALLEHIRRTLRRRSMLIIISDSLQLAKTEHQLLKRLSAQHELMLIAIDDLDPSDVAWNNKDVYDVDLPIVLPTFIRRRKKVNQMYREYVRDEWLKTTHVLKSLGISNVRIRSESAVVNQIIRLLEEHKRARK